MNVYADHAATTPMRACAKEAMLEALEDFGNPSSKGNSTVGGAYGQTAV